MLLFCTLSAMDCYIFAPASAIYSCLVTVYQRDCMKKLTFKTGFACFHLRDAFSISSIQPANLFRSFASKTVSS